MLFTFDLKTLSQGLTDITSEVTEAVSESGVYEGICIVFCPHITASIMIKGDADSYQAENHCLAKNRGFISVSNLKQNLKNLYQKSENSMSR